MKNKENSFDDLFDEQISNALGKVQVTYNPQHWEMMQTQLDALDTQDSKFDSTIAKNPDTMQPAYNPAHWNDFAVKLDAENKLNADFDKTIAASVAAIAPTFNPEHWNAFAAQLDAENKKDADFDDNVAARLTNTEPRYNPEHWDKMSKVLDDHFTWYGKLVRYKVIEMTVLLLAVLSAINVMENYFVPTPTHHQRNPDIKEYLPVPKDSSHVFATLSPKNAERNFTGSVNADIKNNSIKNNSVGENSTQASALTNNSALLNNSAATATTFVNDNKLSALLENNRAGISENKNAVAEIQVLNVLKQLETPTNFSEETNTMNINALNSDIKQQQSDITAISEAQTLPIAPVNTLNADAIALNNTLNFSPVRLTLADKKNKNHWQLGVQLSGNADFVNTSFFNNNRESQVSEVGYSGSGGLTLSYTHKKTEYEGGIIYGSKSLTSQVSLLTGSLNNGYVSKGPGEIELRLLSTTLGVRQTLLEGKHFGLFARIGASFHSAVSIFDKRVTTSTLSTAIQNSLISRSADQIPTYSEAENNKFFTGDLSLGVRYKINSRWSSFLQTSYHQHISEKGIGSLNDHLNSLALEAGLKIKL